MLTELKKLILATVYEITEDNFGHTYSVCMYLIFTKKHYIVCPHTIARLKVRTL